MVVNRERLKKLSSAKQFLLAKKLQKKTLQEMADAESITAIERNQAEWPLSFNQERLWFFDRMVPGTPLYNVAGVLHIHGLINGDVLLKSLHSIVDRHEILRTVFHSRSGKPVQIIQPNVKPGFTHYDIRDFEGDKRRYLQEILKKEAEEVIDLENGPLINFGFVQVAEQESYLSGVVHHIISDGWSMGVLIKDVLRAYGELENNGKLTVRPLSFQHLDYIIWLHKNYTQKRHEQLLTYWKERLGNELPILELPLDKPRKPQKTYSGDTLERILPPEFLAKLNLLTKEASVSLYTLLLGAYTILLHKYSGQSDLIVGSSFANRKFSELNNQIGYYVNAVPIRSHIQPLFTIREFLNELNFHVIGAQEHQDMPFNILVDELGIKRDAIISPIFQALFELQQDLPEYERDGLRAKLTKIHSGTAKFDITLEATAGRAGLHLFVEYSSELFRKETIKKFFDHYLILLERILEGIDQPIGDIQILTDEQRHHLLYERNNNATSFPCERSFTDIFEDVVARCRHSVAASDAFEKVSYLQLQHRSKGVAQKLLSCSLDKEAMIPVFASRSVKLLTAIIGILKSGAAYVPISPELPEKRIKQILNACKSKVILTTEEHYLKLQNLVQENEDLAELEIVSLEEKFDVEESFVYPSTSSRDLCYVIFTSGSTGVPKGVMIEQRGMINHLYAKIADLQLTENDIIAQTASQSFDISIWQFLAALLKGGQVSIINTDVVMDSRRLIDALKSDHISVVELVPSILTTLVEEVELLKDIPCFPDLRYLMVTGETILPETCRNWFLLYPHIPIVNAYGPTECSDDITHYFMTECNSEMIRVPIGTPVANTWIYILDNDLNLVPEGVVGEIYSSGEGVGRGYLGNPEKTSATFIPDPFSQIPGTRMYKTGDMGRWLPDGTIEYLNRRDFQVKVRGFRIELEEIEAVLKMHPHVGQVVVLAKMMESQNTSLVAYFVPKSNKDIEAYELEQYLASSLPAYMIPAIYVKLDTMPLNQNGKIDRNKLPQPEHFKEKKYYPPSSEVEKSLAEIWCQLLDLKIVSIHDSFFELGGDSLQVIQMVSRARSKDLDISPQGVFQNQTIAKLAESATPLDSETQALTLDGAFQIPKEVIGKWNRENPSIETNNFYGLTALQAGLLFNQALTKGAGININQHIISLSGKIDIEAFKKSWRILFEHHDILRTSFCFEEDIPFQVVHKRVTPVIEEIDLSGKDDKEISHRMEALIDEDRARGFDVKCPPLMRLTMVKTGRNRAKFLWTIHQILADGWSIAILGKELFRHYYKNDASVGLKATGQSQYRDYIQWLSQQDTHVSKSFWQKHLKDLPDSALLPVSGDQTIAETAAYTSLRLSVREETVNKLEAIAKTHRLTMNVLIQSAWSIVYSHYTASSDIVYGVNVSGRPAKLNGVENIVGLFINTLPIRVQLKGEQSFLDLGHQLQAVFLKMREFEYTPVWDIANWAERSRQSKEEQLFEAIVGFDNYPLDETLSDQKGHVKVDDFSVVERTGYPFVLDIVPGKELDFKVTFDQRKYALAFIQRMLTNFRTLIEKVSENPFQEIGSYSILAQAELYFLTAHGSNEDPSIPYNQVFQERFQRQVEKTPDHTAVRFEDKTLSYMELNCAATQLAAVLRHKYNIGLESKVVLIAERSIDFMVTILAVWKAGGVYIPLDPEYPAAHYGKVVKICNPTLVLSGQSSLEKINRAVEESGVDDRLTILNFETFLKERNDQELEAHYSSSNAAYIIFTSGSTGLPKGVCVEQKGMVNHIYSKIKTLQLTNDDVTAQLASQCFDISIWQFFAPLLTGGSVIILDDHYSLAPFDLLETVEKHRITVLEMVPSQMRAMMEIIEEVGDHKLASLRWLIATGEALPVDVAQKWNSLFPTVPLLNAYGPTECSDDVTHYVYKYQEDALYNRVPIGTAIENTWTYVLDENLVLVPVGVPGELYIGGIGVGRGYVDEPVKTALNFLPDPFSSVPGARMYKTGDRVMVMEDGHLDFISRLDLQVKVRGFRIELGDIETAIIKHPEVKEALASVITGDGSESLLIAYVIPKSNFDRLQLRDWLKSILPDYMIPSVFIPLDRMPLNRTGKIDRKALPLPQSLQNVESRLYRQPESETEIQLAEKWKEILELNTVSVDDNFFEIGGHSLHAVRIVFWIKKMFNVKLSMVQFFDQPVLGMIAQKIEQLKATSSKDSIVEGIVPVSHHGKLTLSSAQKRLWIIENINPGLPVYNLSDSIRLRGEFDIHLLEKVYRELVHKHAVFRTSFRDQDGEPIQIISPDTALSVNHIYLEAGDADQLEEEAERLAVNQARKPFDLCQAPLIRIDLIHIRPDDILLVQTIHHIISDGWSMGILVNEVAKMYSDLTNGEKLSESAPVLQYTDYAHWHNQYIQSTTVATDLAYWHDILAGELAEIRLPYDFPVGKERSYDGDEVRFNLPSGVQKKLERVCREKNCTPYMFLLTVFKILLHKYSGETDIIVGTPIANRRLAEVESMIGFFVNTLVLRTDLSDDPEVDLVLQKVKKAVVDGLQHQDAPFEKVVEVVNPDRDINSSALFQIMFNFLIAPEIELDLPNVCIDQKELNTGTARFDLTLTFIQQSGHYTGVLNYRVDLFKKETICRMADHFTNLLENILDINAATTPLSKLNVLSSDEYLQVTETFSHGADDNRDVICMHHWFERQVAITPHETALVYGDEKLTYASLDKKANQLARRLIEYGVGPEIFIGLCSDRSVDFLVGMLAILKAGGAYVPLDPAIPSERKRNIIINSGAKVVLSQAKYHSNFVGVARPVLEIEGDYSDKSSDPLLNVAVQPNNPVYSIFTSGSTGNPKGVVVEHKQLFHLVTSSIEVFDFEPGLSYAMVSTFAADLKHTVLFPALCTGGSLHIIATDMALEPNRMAEYFHEHKIDCLKITPNHMKALLQALQPEKTLPKKRLIFGGEGLTLNLTRTLKKISHCKIFNEYGPTETTVAVCCRLIRDVPEQTSTGTIDIGRPFPGNQLYVLDCQRNPLPVGVTGELYIAGVQVSRGYLNNAKNTAKCFVPNPLSGTDDKMYKTGDLVRWLPSGHLEFISRLDNQVKVRGYRVELGEIETCLDNLEQVKESVLLARRDKSGNTNLVAYVVPTFKQINTNEIRTELQHRLPDYMLPHVYVEIENIPLNANGKVNTNNLPEPDLGKMKKVYQEPEGEVEKIIAEIWAQVLGIKSIDVRDNFFKSGGDSMMLMQVIAKAAQKGITIKAKQMFKHQTIGELAEMVSRNQETKGIIPRAVTGDVALTPVQRRFFTLTMGDRSHGHIGFLLEMLEPLDVQRFTKALSLTLEHHDLLRARYRQDIDRGWVQSISSEIESAVVECCSYANMEEVEKHVEQAVKKIDIFNGPLVRAVNYQVKKKKKDLLLFVIHHLVFDVHSIHILMEDLFNTYMRLSDHKKISFPRKTTSYKQWASLLVDYSNSSDLLKEKDYWSSLSQSNIPQIPIDFPNGKNVWSSVSQVSVSLSRSTTHRLLREIPANLGVRIHEALISAVSSVMSEMTQNSTVLLELEGHGRENLFSNVDVSRTIGWFTAHYPALLEVPEDSNAKKIVMRTAQQLKTVPSNGIGFGILRYLLDDEDVKKSLDRISFPEVTVNYQGQFDTLISGSSLVDMHTDLDVQKYAWDSDFERPRKLQILGSVMDHCLNISIEYSRNQYSEETITWIIGKITSFLSRIAE